MTHKRMFEEAEDDEGPAATLHLLPDLEQGNIIQVSRFERLTTAK